MRKKFKLIMSLKKRSLLMLLFALTFSLAGAQTQEAADEQSDVNTTEQLMESIGFDSLGVSIRPPAHFAVSDDFDGFIHLGSASTIIVQREEGTPYVFYKSKKIEQHFEAQGIQVLGVEELKTNAGKKGLLYKLSFSVEGITFIRLIYLTGDHHSTIILNANYPEMAAELLHDQLMASLLSVTFSPLKSE
jgi:hypothetical protein